MQASKKMRYSGAWETRNNSQNGVIGQPHELGLKRGKLVSLLALCEFMKRLNISVIKGACIGLGTLMDPKVGTAIAENELTSILPDLIEVLKELNPDSTAARIGEKLVKFLHTDDVNNLAQMDVAHQNKVKTYLYPLVNSLQEALGHELDTQELLYIEPSSRRFWANPTAGWDAVLAKWPILTFDIMQASKCFATDNWTAVVFHASRCAEHGLRDICVEKGILHNGKLKMMGNYLNDIEQYLKQKDAPYSMELHRVLSTMKSLKEGWRDPTMHHGIEYVEWQATVAYNAVKDGLTLCAQIV